MAVRKRVGHAPPPRPARADKSARRGRRAVPPRHGGGVRPRGCETVTQRMDFSASTAGEAPPLRAPRRLPRAAVRAGPGPHLRRGRGDPRPAVADRRVHQAGLVDQRPRPQPGGARLARPRLAGRQRGPPPPDRDVPEGGTRQTPSPAANKALVRRFWEEENRRGATTIDELVARDDVGHFPPTPTSGGPRPSSGSTARPIAPSSTPCAGRAGQPLGLRRDLPPGCSTRASARTRDGDAQGAWTAGLLGQDSGTGPPSAPSWPRPH
jgi:hypothetical protein